MFTEVDVDKFDGDEDEVETPSRPPHKHAYCDEASAGIPLSNPLSLPSESAAPPRAFPTFTRLVTFALLIVLIVPLMQDTSLLGKKGLSAFGVKGGVIRRSDGGSKERLDDGLVERQSNDPTDYCVRWSHQTALVNGTLYVYGGRASQSTGQTDNTWNNDFLTLDVTKTWQISSPSMNGLPQPSGPPPVANGYLWNSLGSLFLYGGEYSDHPVTSPSPAAVWEYNIGTKSWNQHSNPQTAAGTNADPADQPVQMAAEGAGISVPELGRGWYFGGHLDGYTTAGWSQSIARVYLKSLIEYTFPGYSNTGLSNSQTAGSDGAWRNVTQGGLQESAGFTERADGVLVYVPGYGQDGMILGLAGGTNATFTEMNVIDVFDVASSTWYKQSTTGTSPPIRVNPCAVAASAPDGSSTNIYLYGGQNLIPAGQQTQFDDMWILTIPSFTWIQVDTSGQSVPPARAGHSCNIWDGQLIVVGGYVGPNISCDSPGIYVFDASQLKWQNQFTSLTGGDPTNQQAAQAQNSSGLSGSYGYEVPAAVQSVIGGHASGGATITAPVAAATEGPLATGKPITYTVTASNGATTTETSGTIVSGPQNSAPSGPNIAAIVAGTIAGILAILALYLGFCIWVYRRQLALYKNHVAMHQRAAAAGGVNEKQAFLPVGPSLGRDSSPGGRGKYSTDQSSTAVSGSGRGTNGVASIPPVPSLPSSSQTPGIGRDSVANSSTDDLMSGQEPSFVGVLLNPRRSLRVINRD